MTHVPARQYGEDTGNTASTFHEARTWKEKYQPAGKPLIPLRMIPWSDEFDHETARALFGANLLALTWIKGEPMPGELVDEILRGLGLERQRDKQRGALVRRRSTLASTSSASEPQA